MEEHLLCSSCGIEAAEKGYEHSLCKACRDENIKRPFSLWLRLSFFLIIILMLISLTRVPNSLSAGIAYQRGQRAERAGNYFDAMSYYEDALLRYPDSEKALSRLGVAYYYNEKIHQAAYTFDRLIGRTLSSEDIIELQDIYHLCYETDELCKAMENYGHEELEKTLEKIMTYTKHSPQDLLAHYYMANLYFDMENLKEAEKWYKKIIEEEPKFLSAYLNLAELYRQTKHYEKAREYSNQVLERNKQSVTALGTLSRVELAARKEEEALSYAKAAFEIDNTDLFAAATLAIACHYNGLKAERDELYRLLEDRGYFDLEYVKAVFDGKHDLRGKE